MSRREAASLFGIHRNTVAKMLAFSAPPGYRRQQPRVSDKLEAFIGVIDGPNATRSGKFYGPIRRCRRSSATHANGYLSGYVMRMAMRAARPS
jgi:hypothetical protein